MSKGHEHISRQMTSEHMQDSTIAMQIPGSVLSPVQVALQSSTAVAWKAAPTDGACSVKGSCWSLLLLLLLLLVPMVAALLPLLSDLLLLLLLSPCCCGRCCCYCSFYADDAAHKCLIFSPALPGSAVVVPCWRAFTIAAAESELLSDDMLTTHQRHTRQRNACG
jgi:hypothetical protein